MLGSMPYWNVLGGFALSHHVDLELLLGTALRAPRARHHHTIDHRDYGRVVEASKVHLDS